MMFWLQLLTIAVCVQGMLPAMAQTKTALPSAAQRKYGQDLIKAYQCVSCHVIDGSGAKNGISLDKLKRSKKFVVDHLLDPEEHVEKNAAAFNFDPNLMPSHQLSVAEAQAMADYLLHKGLNRKSTVKKAAVRRGKQ